MLNNLEKITRMIYRERKNAEAPFKSQDHPSEEDLACFLDDKLAAKEKQALRKHLLSCEMCAERVSVQLKIQPHLSLEVPAPWLERVKEIADQAAGDNLLEIFLKLKEQALEIMQTSGDVLFGQELVPAPLLRSRKINEFKEELSILKDWQNIRVMAKIQNKSTKSFNLTITVKDKHSPTMPQDLRVTLLKGEIELESYIADAQGNSFFENILPGNYLVQISRQGQKEALIDLKINI